MNLPIILILFNGGYIFVTVNLFVTFSKLVVFIYQINILLKGYYFFLILKKKMNEFLK